MVYEFWILFLEKAKQLNACRKYAREPSGSEMVPDDLPIKPGSL
jgi:hypothetical protein